MHSVGTFLQIHKFKSQIVKVNLNRKMAHRLTESTTCRNDLHNINLLILAYCQVTTEVLLKVTSKVTSTTPPSRQLPYAKSNGRMYRTWYAAFFASYVSPS